MHLIGTRIRARWRRPLVTTAAVAAAAAIAACGSSSSSSSTSTVSNAAAVSSTTAASTSGAANSGSGSSSGSYTLNVGYIGTTGIFTGPEGFAYSKGVLQQWLKQGGISQIKLAQFANGPLLTAAMVGGSLDVGVVGDTPALIAESHGLPAKFIDQGEVGLEAWIVGKKGVTSLSQLSGQTVTRPQGSYMDRYLQGLLAEKGLTSKVHLTAMLLPQGIPAVESGALAAIALPAWEAGPLLSHGSAVIAKSTDTPNLQGTEVTIATNKILAAHPNVAQIWNGARLKAIAYAKAHAAEFYAFEDKADNLKTPAEAEQFLPLSLYPAANYTPAGLKLLRGTLNFLVSEKEATAFSIDGWKAPGT
jgi:NitT/TauT family transport system substrate-binding protein/sulfonate transport system substrate-binding protein